MSSQKFIDGFSQVHFVGGMVRIDTFVLEPAPGKEPTPKVTGQLVMTPIAFTTALEAMQQLADKLVEAGVLQKTPAGGR